jgi:hypothetical protein
MPNLKSIKSTVTPGRGFVKRGKRRKTPLESGKIWCKFVVDGAPEVGIM